MCPPAALPKGTARFKIWQTHVPALGGAVTQDTAAAGITHAIVPLGGAAGLPPALRPGSSSAPEGLCYVTEEWLVGCIKQYERLPEGDYAPEAAVAAAAAAAAPAAPAAPSSSAGDWPLADSEGEDGEEEEEAEEALPLGGLDPQRYREEFERELRARELPSRPRLGREDEDGRCLRAVSWNLW